MSPGEKKDGGKVTFGKGYVQFGCNLVRCTAFVATLRVWLEIASCDSVAEHYYKGALKQRDVIAGDEVTPVIRSGNFEEWPLKRV